MKAISILITGLIAISFVATPVLAQENSTSDKVLLYLPSSVYKQIPIEEAKRMKNYSSENQYQISVAPDYSSNNPSTEKQEKD